MTVYTCMKQLSLNKCFGLKERRPPTSADGKLPVYDIFCGGGGFGVGAERAGCKVVFGCDSDAKILEVHRMNHPNAVHLCATLPDGAADIPWPTDGSAFHAHFSPPCTKFSKCRTSVTAKRRRDEREDACELLEWSLRTALTCGATSWSLEEVFTSVTRDVLERVRQEYPNRMTYEVVKFEELGVPQTRKRIIAGSPALIATLLRERTLAKKTTIADVMALPTGVKHLHTGCGVSALHPETWAEHLWPVTDVGPTVLADGALWWIRLSTNGGPPSKEVLTAREAATLQTFPATYKLPQDKKLGRRIIGNAVPPLVSELLLRDVGRES